MKLGDIFHGESLKADDMKGQAVTLTIERWALKEFEEHGKPEKKIELVFYETDRTLICNKTNGYAIAEFLGDDLDRWKGHKIELFPTTTEFQGKRVPCIRVRQPQAMQSPESVPPTQQPPPQPQPLPGTPRQQPTQYEGETPF